MKEKIRDHINIRTVFLAVAFAVTLVPALLINTQKDVKSSIDNRALTEFPELDENFIEGLNEYVEDRIGFREQAIASYQVMNNSLFHYLVHPLYEYGRGEWIMTKEWDPVQTYHLDLEDGFADRFARFMKEAQEISRDSGADFLLLLIPNKETVYPEELNPGYTIVRQETKSDRILAALDGEKVPYLYLLPRFLELKDSVQLYNVKDDPGHWNEHGYFYGNAALIDHLRTHFNDSIEPLTADEFDVGTRTAEYLNQSSIRINEEVPDYVNRAPLYKGSKESFWKGVMDFKREPVYVRNEARPDAPKLLIVHDSYFNGEAKFIGNHFSEVCLIHSGEIGNFRKFVELYDPDIVVIEATERVIGPGQNYYNNKVLNAGL